MSYFYSYLMNKSPEQKKKTVVYQKYCWTRGIHHSKAFKCLQLNLNQVDKKISIDQADYFTTWKPIDISKERKRDQSIKLNQNELDCLKTVIGQLGWFTSQTRPDLAFETCMLRSTSKNATVNEIIQANKILEKAQKENLILRFSLKGNIKNFKIIRLNDASFGNLSDGSSQGGYKIYLVKWDWRMFPNILAT